MTNTTETRAAVVAAVANCGYDRLTSTDEAKKGGGAANESEPKQQPASGRRKTEQWLKDTPEPGGVGGGAAS